MKMASNDWNELPEKKRAKYFKMNEDDKARFEAQCEEIRENGYFVMDDGTKSSEVVESKKKGLIPGYEGTYPKKPSSAYIFYGSDKVKELRAADSELKQTDAMKQAGEIWNGLTEDEKQPFEDKKEADKVRYDKQMAQIEKKGYYMMDDGKKSSEVAPKEKKTKKEPVEKQKKRTRSGNPMPEKMTYNKKDKKASKQAKGKKAKEVVEEDDEESEIDIKESSSDSN
jgi:hypothetical protein